MEECRKIEELCMEVEEGKETDGMEEESRGKNRDGR